MAGSQRSTTRHICSRGVGCCLRYDRGGSRAGRCTATWSAFPAAFSEPWSRRGPERMSSSASYLDPVVLPLIVGESVLDVACGYGRWCHLIQSNYWEAGLSQPPVVDGFDAFEPNVAHCRRSGCYRKLWQQTLPSALDGTWDTVLACEVIEH